MMVNRININTHVEHDTLTRQDTGAINYPPANSKRSYSKENPRIDDLIVSLADAHENERARQVTEWEQMRQHDLPLSI
ncbi:MAG: hypothetical protein ABIO36_04860 [Pyrinomonadaceae bacterium]